MVTQNIKAIKYSEQKARELAGKYPEIADRFRRGMPLDKLAIEYIGRDYDLSPSTARNTIRYTLIEQMGKDEEAKIAKEHLRANGEKIVGILNRSGAQRKGYKKGIGRLTNAERHDAGRKSVIKRGQIPFEFKPKKTQFGKMSEPEYIIYLKEEAFQSFTWEEIADEVNEVFDRNRDWATLRSLYHRWKRK